jgi:hypothetical protein
MAEPKEPSENPAKGAGSGESKPSLERFKNLTRRLIGVTREELAEAERRKSQRRPS